MRVTDASTAVAAAAGLWCLSTVSSFPSPVPCLPLSDRGVLDFSGLLPRSWRPSLPLLQSVVVTNYSVTATHDP